MKCIAISLLFAAAAVNALPSSTRTSNAIGPLGGVNTAGYDFGPGVVPPVGQCAHFAARGVKIFRIPFGWNLMTPTLGGSIDETWFSTSDKTVQAALSSSTLPYVILDLHNYARWNGGIVGQGGPTNPQFADVWSRIAKKYASQSKIIFGIMNEPHDIPSIPDWAASVQAAVNAIRAAGATTQYMLLPGSSYSSAGALPTEAGPDLAALTDPAGGTSQLIFDVHQYLDSNGSGSSTECVKDNVDVLTTLVAWLKSIGNRQALLSETGGGSTASCEKYLASELAYVKANSEYIVGFTVWAAGSFDTTYNLTVTPNTNGSDQPIWTDAVVPNLP
ncbi:glycoside hydrolase family 5 protein [Athelia psychrophila]|uniref:cellulase n=1 Tax=Athelia psychrophila TaxID=1759441 RepID=A0A167VMP3_9AGAM|nr:glycoside hydrolase family 5 protein [Fibularhizoctonia sp. CBS 109695]